MIRRREFLRQVVAGAAAGAAGARSAGAEPPPETPRLRMSRTRFGICVAPKYVADEFLRAEGFSDIQYVEIASNPEGFRALAAGETDVETTFVPSFISRIEAGDPFVILAGLHAGCFELIGGPSVRAIRDLKGKSIGVGPEGGPDRAFVASMLAHVGLDPRTDVRWVTLGVGESVARFAEGRVDAILGLPPVPQDVRARGIGHVVVNSATDRPWSQYFCCVVAANKTFVRRHPTATKRALRAIVKAIDVCAADPAKAARRLLDRGVAERYELALQSLKDVPYARWREYDVEDSIRFYALRMHEAGMIKTNPKRIIAEGTDWRFLKELRKELKG